MANFFIDEKAVQKLKLVAVAYSHVDRADFATEEAYKAEIEVQGRAQQVVEEIQKLGVPVKSYPGNQYLLSLLNIDDPELVVNLVDTLKGRDLLQTSVPAALRLADIPYTGAGMQGLVIGNNRHLTKQLLQAFSIPTPEFQYMRSVKEKIDSSLPLPLIVKLNESGGSVGIDNHAVKENHQEAEERAHYLISTYSMPVIIEKFIDGREMNVIVYHDGRKHHVFIGEKIFRETTDGKHTFTSLETYDDINSWTFQKVEGELAKKISKYATLAFDALHHKDYAKFDVRVDDKTEEVYITDSNPNTAFGPGNDIPITQVLQLYGHSFQELLLSLLSKHAKLIDSKRS